MALTTSDLRSMLRSAWSDDLGDGDLLIALRQSEKQARDAIAGGQLSSTSANGRSVALANPSPYVINPTEVARGWDELIRLYNKARRFLNYCSVYGVEPVSTEAYPISPPPAKVAQPVPYHEADLYEWLMGSEEVGNFNRKGSEEVGNFNRNWPGQLVEITESRGDYGSIRIAQGTQFT